MQISCMTACSETGSINAVLVMGSIYLSGVFRAELRTPFCLNRARASASVDEQGSVLPACSDTPTHADYSSGSPRKT
jgi:hypothetical protein